MIQLIGVIFLVAGFLSVVSTKVGAQTGAIWEFPLDYEYGQPTVSPQGDVLVATGNWAGGSGPRGTQFQAVTSAGSSSWSLPYMAGHNDSDPPVYDQTGDAYWVDSDVSNIQTLIASRDGVQRWSKLLGQPATTPVLGTNGLLYLVESLNGGIQYDLIGLSRVDGTTLVEQPLREWSPSLSSLFAYADGLVSIGPASITFRSYSGQATKVVPLPPKIANHIGVYNQVSVALSGNVFVRFGPGCDGDTTPGYLARIGPDGSIWSEIAVPSQNGACSLGAVAALPDGGVAYAASSLDRPDGYGVSAYNSDGSLRWHDDGLFTVGGCSIDFNQAIPPTTWQVDTAGHLIGLTACSIVNQAQQTLYGAIVVSELDSATGAMLSQQVITAANDPKPRTLWGTNTVSTPNRAYVTGWDDPDSGVGTAALWALDMPGLTGDWPSTVIRSLAGGGTQGPAVTAVSSAVGPTTPLWHLDVSLHLANVTCPASATLTVQGRTSTRPVCQAGQAVPTSFKWPNPWPVFEGTLNNGTTPYQLPVASSIGVAVTVTGSNAPFLGTITTPTAPVWVGVGDSFSSGHHEIADRNHCIILPGYYTNGLCGVFENDPGFSWVSEGNSSAASQLNARLSVPTAWAMTPDLQALSGAATTQLVSDGQMAIMQGDLQAHARSWNVVSFTGGANDANFAKALGDWYPTHGLGKPWGVSKWSASACPDSNALYARAIAAAPSIRSALQSVLTLASTSAPGTRFVDVEYPYVVPNTNPCGASHSLNTGTWYGSKAVVDFLDRLHAQLTAPGLVHVDLRKAFNNDLSDLQLLRLYGYPHPNAAGQFVMARLAEQATR